MRTSPRLSLLLIIAMPGCKSGTPPPGAPAPTKVSAVKPQTMLEPLAFGDPITNSIGMLMIPIPPGEFQMGSPDSDRYAPDQKPQHLVKIEFSVPTEVSWRRAERCKFATVECTQPGCRGVAERVKSNQPLGMCSVCGSVVGLTLERDEAEPETGESEL